MQITLHISMPADEPVWSSNDQVLHRPLFAVLSALTELNRLYLRRHPWVPRLCRLSPGSGRTSGVRYIQDVEGQENWGDVGWTLGRGGADCKCLCAWLAAEWQLAGVAAECTTFNRRLGPNRRLYHVQVLMPDGRVLDPSYELGMPVKSLY